MQKEKECYFLTQVNFFSLKPTGLLLKKRKPNNSLIMTVNLRNIYFWYKLQCNLPWLEQIAKNRFKKLSFRVRSVKGLF